MLVVGDDWAENHHDVEIVYDTGRVLARRRLPEGPGGITRLHALIGEHMSEGWAEWEPAQTAAMVKVGIETDRGPWVAALVAGGRAPDTRRSHPRAHLSTHPPLTSSRKKFGLRPGRCGTSGSNGFCRACLAGSVSVATGGSALSSSGPCRSRGRPCACWS